MIPPSGLPGQGLAAVAVGVVVFEAVVVLAVPAGLADALPEVRAQLAGAFRVGDQEPLPELLAGGLVLGVANPRERQGLPEFAVVLLVAGACAPPRRGGAVAGAAALLLEQGCPHVVVVGLPLWVL